MRRRAHPHEHQGELNVIPYLDIMVNLVMFMLMSMTGFVTYQSINTTAPAWDRTGDPPPPDDGATGVPFVLNVSISRTGFVVAEGGETPGSRSEVRAPTTIPLKGPTQQPRLADYDLEALTSRLRELKQRHPTHTGLVLAADPAVPYELVVATMDASRGDRARPLFPEVAFGAFPR